ncbi:MAG TPA: hypothetical protein VKN99_21285 [Polyangia bacterium]|nr:hypothetical protein [Polyangia bacterium]
MRAPEVALVTTTINVPKCLDAYLDNLARHGHADGVSVVVVGDHKTPPETGAYLAQLGKRFPARIVYMDVPTQRELLKRWPAFDLFLRYNCIQRRNVGYLQAALDGAQVMVALDDDNFVTEEDYLGAHLQVGREVELPVVSHASGWWNVCEQLECDPPRRFYHRGYPKSRQNFAPGGERVERRRVRVAVNAGLWLKNPDVDATANIEEPLNVVRMLEVAGAKSWALAAGTWCPFNSQNTAFHVSTLPAMYLVVMLDYFRGYRIGRLDDIWMSYFVRAIGDQLGEHVSYGSPLVVQDRNPHNFVKDLSEELGGYILTELLCGWLREFRTGARTWLDAYLDLTYHLAAMADQVPDDATREYFRVMTVGMAAWQGAVAEVLQAR